MVTELEEDEYADELQRMDAQRAGRRVEGRGVSVDGGDGVAEDVAEEDVTAIAPEVKRDGKVRECASVCVCVDVSACVCMYASP